jgi:hypothetical protein
MWSNETRQAASRSKRKLPTDTTSDPVSKHRKKAAPSNSHTNDHYLHQNQSQWEIMTASSNDSQPNHRDHQQYQSWSQTSTVATNTAPTIQRDLRCDSLRQTSQPTTGPPSYSLRPLGGDTAKFDVSGTFALLSSVPEKTRERPQRFNENDNTVALRVQIHNHVRGPLPPLPVVCGRCGRSDLSFEHLLKHQKSPYCLDLPAYKVVYAHVILGLPLKKIPLVLACFDAATAVVGMRYVFPIEKIQALMAGCQDSLAWARWFANLPKFVQVTAALDRYFAVNSWPPPYPLDQ